MSMVLLFTLNIKSFLVVLVEPGCLRILLYFGSLFFFLVFPCPVFLVVFLYFSVSILDAWHYVYRQLVMLGNGS